MMATSTVAGRARIVWFMRLSSALRTASACAIVGGATIHGPKFLAHQIKFAAFSYLTAVLIVSDAALVDTVKGCWHAFCATAQVVPLAMLGRWIIAPTAKPPVSMAAVATGVAAFLVALPECTHLTAKKIAFGQIVLVCTDVVVGDGSSNGFMHPLYVAASTALGALASLLALMVPCPGLACYKVRKLCRVYAENASKRMNIYLRAFGVRDNRTRMKLVSQAKLLSETGAKLLQSIRILQEGMQWERPWNPFDPGKNLQRMELQMRGIEYSLVSSPAFSIQVIDEEQLDSFLKGLSIRIEEKIEQISCFSSLQSVAQSDTRREFMENPLLPLDSVFPTLEHGWIFFYFSCIDMFLNDTSVAPREVETHPAEPKFCIVGAFKTWIQKLSSPERLKFAFKCSLSLSLAVLFGLMFDIKNGCWAGLTIAISFDTGRQTVFTIANTRAQGTAIGSVYGVICCFVFRCEEARLLALLPWIIFTSLLRHSKMYGQTGGFAAAIGALLILGRKDYGVPNEFALARLTEVFIGLSAFVVVELCLQKVRSATLAKNHLYLTLRALQGCIREIGIYQSHEEHEFPNFLQLKEKQRNLNNLICELKGFVADAELEPDFWYSPFRTSCYKKLVGSLSNIVDLLDFITNNFQILLQLSETSNVGMEFQEQINNEWELFQKALSSLQIYTEQAVSTESLADSQDPIDENSGDLEAGEVENTAENLITENIERDRTTQEDSEDNEKVRERMIQCLSGTGFCISSLMKESGNIESCMREIDQWENHSSR